MDHGFVSWAHGSWLWLRVPSLCMFWLLSGCVFIQSLSARTAEPPQGTGLGSGTYVRPGSCLPFASHLPWMLQAMFGSQLISWDPRTSFPLVWKHCPAEVGVSLRRDHFFKCWTYWQMEKRADKNSLSFGDFTDNVLVHSDNKISAFVNKEQT